MELWSIGICWSKLQPYPGKAARLLYPLPSPNQFILIYRLALDRVSVVFFSPRQPLGQCMFEMETLGLQKATGSVPWWILSSWPPTLYGVPKIQEHLMATAETFSHQQTKLTASFKLRISKPRETSVPDDTSLSDAHLHPIGDAAKEVDPAKRFEIAKETDTVSNCSKRKKSVLKIKVKQPGSSSKAEDTDQLMENSRGGQNDVNEVGPASSVSVDAPINQEANEPPSAVNHNIEEVNSCHDYGSRMSASVGSSVKPTKDGYKELQCTADSKKIDVAGHSSIVVDGNEVAAVYVEHPHLGSDGGDGRAPLTVVSDEEVTGKRKKEKKRDKEKKRKREEPSIEKDRSSDPDYMERKRQKEKKKRLEKELAKMKQKADGMSLGDSVKLLPEPSKGSPSFEGTKKLQIDLEDYSIIKAREASSGPKLKIKIRTLGSGNG